jgi:hypothetical protein
MSQLCFNKVKTTIEILFRASWLPLWDLEWWGQRTLASPPNFSLWESCQFLNQKKWPTKEHFNHHGGQIIPTKVPVGLWNFALSGNEIVFSSKNEFVTDAACANDDNLLSSKITSLHFLQPTDEALEITGYGETERKYRFAHWTWRSQILNLQKN